MVDIAGHAGTAYVEIRPDFATLNRELAAEGPRLASRGKQLGAELSRSFKVDPSGARRGFAAGEASARQYGRVAERAHAGVRRRAEESVATNALLTGSFRQMARTAVTAGAGFAAAYVGLAKAKDAVKSTEELAHATEVLHRNTGLSIKSSSDWVGIAQARGIQSGALSMSFTRLSKAFIGADKGQKAASDSLKALGLTQAQVHAGAGNFGTALNLTADSLGKMKGGTDRLAASQSVLGRGSKDLIPLFSEGRKGLDEQLGAAKKYGVELNSQTLPLLDKLVANQRQTKLASLGMKVAFTEAVAPGLLKVEGAALRVARVLNDPSLSSDERWKKIGKIVGPLVKSVEHQAEAALPAIASTVGRNAPKVALAFVHGFEQTDIWGKLAIGTFLLKRMGGIGAFAALGRRGGVAMGAGVAEGEAAAASGGRFARVGRLIGNTIGVAAAAVIAAKISSSLSSTAVDLVTLGLQKPKRQIQIEHDTSVLNQAQRLGLEHDTGPRGSTTRADLTVAAQHAQRSGRLGLATDLTQIEKDFPKIQAGNLDKARQAFDKYSKSAKDAKAATQDMTDKTVNLIAGWRRTAESDVTSTAKTMGLKSKEGQRSVTAAFKAAAGAIKQAMDSGQISTQGGMREMRNIMGIYSKSGKDAVAKNTSLFVGNVRQAMRKGEIATRDGMKYIHDAFAAEARSFGLSKPAALQLAGIQSLQSQGTPVTGRAKGGFAGGGVHQFGSPGGNGPDNILANIGGETVRVGSGEVAVVYNGDQIADMNVRLAREGGLGGYFRKPWRDHSAAQSARAFAQGGAVKHVPRVTVAGRSSDLKTVVQGSLDKSRDLANEKLDKLAATAAKAASVLGGISVGGATGPSGVGTWNGIPVANWLINALKWAKAHGGNTQITSGYRPGFDPTTASGTSEHQGTRYPHGAIDFGGRYNDPVALAHKLSFLRSLRGYPGPKPILPIGFHDDGHLSGTGHAKGGIVGLAKGGDVSAARHLRLHGHPMFHAEGPRYYDAAYKFFHRYAKRGPYQTPLRGHAEGAFRSWVHRAHVPFDIHARRSDYDMRGFWSAGGSSHWHRGSHFPDTYKTPYDTTFSRQPRYATRNNPFDWVGNKLVNMRTGRIIFAAKGGVVGKLAGLAKGGPVARAAGAAMRFATGGWATKDYRSTPNYHLSATRVDAVRRSVGLPSIFDWVALAESTDRPGIVNGIHATGLWQIYNHPDLVRRYGSMTVPLHNAQAAKSLYNAGGMGPWAASRSGWSGHSGPRLGGAGGTVSGGGSGAPHITKPGGTTLEVGDSLGVGTRPYLKKVLGGKVFSDVLGGRSSASGVAALRKLLKRHPHPDRIFFDLGTNDGSASAFAASLKQADAISGTVELLVPLLHGPKAASKNAELHRLAAASSDIRVFNPGLKGLGGDHIHFSAAGYKARAARFARAAGAHATAPKHTAQIPKSIRRLANIRIPHLGDFWNQQVARYLGRIDQDDKGEPHLQNLLSAVQSEPTLIPTELAARVAALVGQGTPPTVAPQVAALERLIANRDDRLQQLVNESNLGAVGLKAENKQIGRDGGTFDKIAKQVTAIARKLGPVRAELGRLRKIKKPSAAQQGKLRALSNESIDLGGELKLLTGTTSPNVSAHASLRGISDSSTLGRINRELSAEIGRRDTLKSSLADLPFSIQEAKDELDLGAGSLRGQLATLTGKAAGTSATDNSGLVDLLKQQLREANVRTAVSERQFQVLRDFPPYGGSFATGGVVPGPPGEPRTIIAHGGETITPEGQAGGDVQVILNVAPGMEWLRQFIQVETRRTTRSDARTGARVLAGRGGGGF